MSTSNIDGVSVQTQVQLWALKQSLGSEQDLATQIVSTMNPPKSNTPVELVSESQPATPPVVDIKA